MDQQVDSSTAPSYDSIPTETPEEIAVKTVNKILNQGPVFTVYLILDIIPFALYLFGWLLFSSVFQWVFVIITSAISFWFTKNVAGKLILGLMWSNRVNDEGQNVWLFETYTDELVERNTSKKYFWWALYITTALWALFAFFSVIRLKLGWVMSTSIALTLSFYNTWGYMKSDSNAKRQAGETTSHPQSSILPFLVDGARARLSSAMASQFV